jgi:glycosyltransferase involved in cell wall biosynthesis
MPVYNGEPFIEEAILSILNQTYRNFEFIIVNDSSTDKSAEIAKKYAQKDSRILVIPNENTRGIVGALNTGLKHAGGIYIARMDSDDISRSDRFQKQIDFLESHKQIDVIGGIFKTFDEKGDTEKIWRPHGSIWIAWLYISNAYLGHPSIMMRRAVLLTTSEYPKTTAEDFAFFSDIIHTHQAENISDIVLDYRIHSSNISLIKKDKLLESVHETFLKNYSFYLNATENSDIFWQFQSKHYVSIQNIFFITKRSFTILRKIRNNYNIKFLTLNNISAIIKVSLLIFASVIITVLRKAKKWLLQN